MRFKQQQQQNFGESESCTGGVMLHLNREVVPLQKPVCVLQELSR